MTHKRLLIVIALTGIVLAAAYGGYRWHRKHEAPSATKAMPHERLLVINVLDEPYYSDMHIVGSVHIPFGNLGAAADLWIAAKQPLDTSIVLYCSNYMCTASGAGVKLLRSRGFTNVRAYEGGMAEWYQLAQKDASYQISGPGKEAYLQEVVAPPAADAGHGAHVITAQALRELLGSFQEPQTQS